MLFAFGEIILVMVGILLALQIDTLVSNKENDKEERRILTNLLEQDLRNDIEQLTRLIHLSDSITQTIMVSLTGEKN